MNENEKIDTLIYHSQNDMNALEQLYYIFKNDVYSFAFSILGNFYLAEECLQETFLRIPAAATKYKSKQHGKTFIFAITKNIAREIRRKENRTITFEYTENTKTNSNSNNFEEKIYIEQLFKCLSQRQR